MSNKNRNLWDEYKKANNNLTFDNEGNLLRGNLSIEDYKIAANLYDSANQEEELERQYKAKVSELEDQRVVDRQEQLALQERINKYMTQSQGASGIDGTGVAEGLKLRANNAYNTALRDIDKQNASAQDDLYSKYVTANNELYNTTQTNNIAYLQEKATADEVAKTNKYNEIATVAYDMENQGKSKTDIAQYLASYKDYFGENNSEFNVLWQQYKDYVDGQSTNAVQTVDTSQYGVDSYVNLKDLNNYFGSGKNGAQDAYFNALLEDYNNGKIPVGSLITPNLGARANTDYSANYFVVTERGLIPADKDMYEKYRDNAYIPNGYKKTGDIFFTVNKK